MALQLWKQQLRKRRKRDITHLAGMGLQNLVSTK